MSDRAPEALLAVYEGAIAARIERRGVELTLRYDERWRERGQFPLSLSLPLARAEHESKTVEHYLSNLLPDNARVLEAWGRRFHVSARNPFRLLSHVGEDCAGAFAFVSPERFEDHRGRTDDVEWLDEADLGERLRDLRVNVGNWRRDSDAGQFSLAGAQAKIALLHRDGRWGIPGGRMPTTHILKPPIPGFDGHVENEHFCLRLAGELGLDVARSRVHRFDGELAIVLERFDRAHTAALAAAAAADAAVHAASEDPRAVAETARAAARAAAMAQLAQSIPVLRLHQEDLCQALGVPPERKYQSDGGPSPEDVAAVLRSFSSDVPTDLRAFRDALLLEWLIAGTDAHAKNYGLLHGGAGRVRLAPLYDVASALPYDHLPRQKLKLAMKVGNTYRLRDMGRSALEGLADALGLGRDETVERARTMASQLEEATAVVRARAQQEDWASAVVDRLHDRLVERARECASL